MIFRRIGRSASGRVWSFKIWKAHRVPDEENECSSNISIGYEVRAICPNWKPIGSCSSIAHGRLFFVHCNIMPQKAAAREAGGLTDGEGAGMGKAAVRMQSGQIPARRPGKSDSRDCRW
jgi:hypothetical protein